MFKDTEHLIRLAAVMAIAVIAFVVLRSAVVPRTFGQYGHYRGAAIAEAAAPASSWIQYAVAAFWTQLHRHEL